MYLELHGADFVEGLSHVLPDHGPGDFVVTLCCGLHRVSGHVVKSNHVWEDADSFVEGAEPVRRDRRMREAHSLCNDVAILVYVKLTDHIIFFLAFPQK